MAETELKIGDQVLGRRYELLRQVKGSVGGERTYIGSKGVCRYCGCTDESNFRKVAHTFPEALGNKWVISRDECDDCNQKFSLYEDSLTKSVSPFLTLGGVKAKSNKTRQTGRTKGRSFIKHLGGDVRRRISMFLNIEEADWKDHVSFDPTSGRFRLAFPIAGVPFKPRYAYKAITKMGVALLPDDELVNYQQLRAWLLDDDDNLDFPNLEVAMSFGSIGNAPPLVCGSLLRRVNPADRIPHILFLLSAGSIFLQIDLMSDHMEDHLPLVLPGTIKIKWSNVLGDLARGEPVRIDYGQPVFLNWSSRETAPQPIESMVLDFCPRTCVGNFTPIFR